MPVWQDIHFAYPGIFWAAPGVLLLMVIVSGKIFRLDLPALLINSVSKRYYRHPKFDLLHEAVRKSSQTAGKRIQWVGLLFYAVLSAFISASLAQPYQVGKQLPEPPRYRDIMFVVDTSINMILRDYAVQGRRVQRMTMMKDVLSHFIHQLQGNRMGVIAFSEQAYTLVPMTTDYVLLNTQIQRLDSATLTGRTNNLSHALLYTYKQLAGASHGDEQDARPVIVLLTSVNRPTRDMDPRAVARFYKQNGFYLHTIAIGAPDYIEEEKKSVSLIYHPANFKLLEDVATESGGLFFWAKNTDSLKQAVQTIQQASLRKVEVQARYIEIPLYHWPLLAALVWIILWQLLPVVSSHFSQYRKIAT